MIILATIFPFIISRIIWQFYKHKIDIFNIKVWESILFWPWITYIAMTRDIYCQIKPVDKSRLKKEAKNLFF